MTNCTQESFKYPVCKKRIVEANVQGGDITSDGGVLLLQQVDRQLGLSEAVVHVLDDPRRQASVDHDGLSSTEKPCTAVVGIPKTGKSSSSTPNLIRSATAIA